MTIKLRGFVLLSWKAKYQVAHVENNTNHAPKIHEMSRKQWLFSLWKGGVQFLKVTFSNLLLKLAQFAIFVYLCKYPLIYALQVSAGSFLIGQFKQ